MSFPARGLTDACPGVLAPHDAADGELARIRLPGGVISAAPLRALAECADEFGDGAVHLTSRGNLQLRGLRRDETGLLRRLSSAGLLPSPTHERVRNILASPLSGLSGGFQDVRTLVARLDSEICSHPEFARLPGRFLFALDDGRGDISGEGADLCWRAVDAAAGALLLDGIDTGFRVAASLAVEALVTVAEAFLAVRGSAWRVRELPDPTVLLGAVRGLALEVDPVPMPVCRGVPVGVLAQEAGGTAIGLAPPFGRLSSAQVWLLADVAPRVVVTPWRSLLLPDTRAGQVPALADAGFVVEPDAPSLGVSACIGRPGCVKSRADVRADASKVVPGLTAGLRVHFAGCERRCGRPAGEHIDVVAECGGYRVNDGWVPVARLADSLRGKA